MTTGTGIPGSRFWVVALNTLQNSMMLSPRWPRAGPIGGDGFALPAGTCNLMMPTIFFAISFSNGPTLAAPHPGPLPARGEREGPLAHRRCATQQAHARVRLEGREGEGRRHESCAIH